MKPRRTKIKANRFKEDYAPSQPTKPDYPSDNKTIVSRSQSRAITLSARIPGRKMNFLDLVKPHLRSCIQIFSLKVMSPVSQKVQTLNSFFFSKMDQIILSDDVFSYAPPERNHDQPDNRKDLFLVNEYLEAAGLFLEKVKFQLADVEKLILRRLEKVLLFCESVFGLSADLQPKPVVFEVVNNHPVLGRKNVYSNFTLNDLAAFTSSGNTILPNSILKSFSFYSFIDKSQLERAFQKVYEYASNVLIKKFVKKLPSLKLSITNRITIPDYLSKPDTMVSNPGYP